MILKNKLRLKKKQASNAIKCHLKVEDRVIYIFLRNKAFFVNGCKSEEYENDIQVRQNSVTQLRLTKTLCRNRINPQFIYSKKCLRFFIDETSIDRA